MEEFLITLLNALFEILGELLLQLIAEFLTELLWHLFRSATDFESPTPRWFSVVGSGCVGAVLGYATLWIFPHHLIHSTGLRLGMLILAPVAVGFLMWTRGQRLEAAQRGTVPVDRFWEGATLAFGFALIRYRFAVG